MGRQTKITKPEDLLRSNIFFLSLDKILKDLLNLIFKIMKRVLFFLFIMIVHSLSAQNYVHQVLILNEGYFDYQTNQIMEPVTIGSYNPNTQTYTTIDTINGARFASDFG